MPAMSASTTRLQIPHGECLDVKLINTTNFGPGQLHRFMGPPVPGFKTLERLPSLSFLLEHRSGRKVIFDLGIRKDYHNYAPTIAQYIPTTNYTITVERNVVDVLQEGGISLGDVEAVVWSHWHWDHVGDPSTFPPTTDLVVGPGFKDAMLPGSPTNPESPIQESDYSGRRLREIMFNDPSALFIDQFPAFDYFGDGSFYLLNSPGHAVGHLSGLARTTVDPPTFVLMGGDICHYAGIFRPSELLPIPETIDPPPYRQLQVPLCPGTAFTELQVARGRTETDTLFDIGFGHDIPLATKTMKQLQQIDCDEDVFVIVAHDANVRDGVDHFPRTLNQWKEKGWGHGLKWAFLWDLHSHWQDKGIMST